MTPLKFDFSNALDFIGNHEISYLKRDVLNAHNQLHQGGGAGSDFLGWVDLPINYDRNEYQRIKECAKRIQDTSDVLIVIGIGGSYLGAKAGIDLLTHSFHNLLPKEKRTAPQIFFAGNHISSTYLTDLLELIEGRDISVNVISKSGTTTEPAIAFRILKKYLEEKYGVEEAQKRIYATTDSEKGALRDLATNEGYETFVIPDDVGGRYSVLTAVGLLPLAVAGIDIEEIMSGAQASYQQYLNPDLEQNICYQYATIRNLLYRKGKTIEILVNYEPSFHYFAEWWKQLFGESKVRIIRYLPAAVDFVLIYIPWGNTFKKGYVNYLKPFCLWRRLKKYRA